MKRLLIIAFSLSLSISINAQTKMTEKDDIKLSPTKTDGLLMQDGKMMQMKDGLSKPIEKDVTLKNGTIVMKDGTVKTKNGKTIVLKDGDWIMMDGTLKNKAAKKKAATSKM
ncbi:MAG: DUF6799 domain-containing protein [Ferruginibacter sp.]